MKAWKEITYYGGFEWARDHHAVVIVDRRGQMVADFAIEPCRRLAALARASGRAGGGELSGVSGDQPTPGGRAIAGSGVTVYPIAPVSSKAYRSAPPQWDQDRLMLEFGGCPPPGWSQLESLAKEDPLIAELRLLCRDEIALIEERTALLNQLQSALQEYYPAALEAFEDWTLPAAWAFVEVFPMPAALAGAGKRNGKVPPGAQVGRPQTYAKGLEIFARGSELAAGEALTAARAGWRSPASGCCGCSNTRSRPTVQIEKLFAQHPDHHLSSAPRAGPKIAPRLLGEIGSDWSASKPLYRLGRDCSG